MRKLHIVTDIKSVTITSPTVSGRKFQGRNNTSWLATLSLCCLPRRVGCCFTFFVVDAIFITHHVATVICVSSRNGAA